MAAAKRQIDLGGKERVRTGCAQAPANTTLGPRSLNRLVGMSRSNLYRLFDDSGGVAQCIQRARLREAWTLLSNHATATGGVDVGG